VALKLQNDEVLSLTMESSLILLVFTLTVALSVRKIVERRCLEGLSQTTEKQPGLQKLISCKLAYVQ